jgi:alpha/beta superfamily hydrolase/peroxiredoxin
MKKIFLTTLTILLATTTSVKAQSDSQKDFDSKYATELVKPGTIAPDFKMKTIDGKTFRLKDLKGKTVVLDFWASWCPDCRKDAPEVVRMYKEYHPQGVEFVGVSMDTDVEAWRKSCSQFGITYPQVSELKKFKDTDIAKAYGVKWIPSMVVIDKEGRVALSTVLPYKVDKYLKELHPTGFKPDYDTLTIDGDHGKLVAVIQKPQLKPGEQCPMVVLCHGFNGTKEFPLLELIADSLQKNAIASIRFDYNGHGQSEGEFQDMTVPNEIVDTKHVLNYVRDLRYVSKIALAGHSQGGVVAAMTAGEVTADNSMDLSAVVLMAPGAVLREDALRGNFFGALFDPLDPPEYLVLGNGIKLGGKYIKTTLTLPIYETAAKYQGPALIIHGNGDRLVPYTYGLRFHQQWPNSEYVLQEYFDHLFSQNTYRTADIISDYLIKTMQK